MATTVETRTPAHLWIVGILSALWNAFGCYDYLMTATQNAEYLKMIGGEDAIAYFTSFPSWVVAFWAIAVWGSLGGSLALLARSRWAVSLFGAALVGLLVTTVYQFGITTMPASLQSPGVYGMTAAIWIVAIGLFVYARAMTARGVLR